MIDSNQSLAPGVEAASAPFMGQWRRLVSTTNWEKGRIICEWRQALVAADAPAAEFADEAWSRLVGGVTGQHVGRLRRVYERFGSVREGFSGLFWSHFQAALDWDDAEMWLEGAVQSRWSVSQMRDQRWETREAVDGAAPRVEVPAETELDEDSESDEGGSSAAAVSSRPQPMADGGEQLDRRARSDSSDGDDDSTAASASTDDESPIQRPAPFAHLAQLPDDLADAFEAFKLAIVRHRLAGWGDVARDDVLSALAALGELAMAPVEER